MSKKLGKILVLGAIAGIAAAGVYHYLQTKDKELEDLDDFDDLDDLDDDSELSRSYVNLDTDKASDETPADAEEEEDAAAADTGATTEDFFNDSQPTEA
ncbi:MAG: hypothetical protein J6Z42_04355 [Lachnospiraceae bacterium]|nr:hypothetical protein [Lachnospiraceae bacterium]